VLFGYQTKKIEFYFEDMYSNFNSFPEYPGRQAGKIALHGVSDLSIALETSDRLRVFEFLPDKDESDVVLLTFWPEGSIRVRFHSADYPPFQLVTDTQ
jgi:hypothetical protein